MKHVIFIRSYARDLEWLKFCLRSIERFVTGCDAVVVVVPYSDVSLFNAHGIDCVGCEDMADGYVGQQRTKHYADNYCTKSGEDCWIIYTDSDCVFTAPTTMDSLFVNGKPIHLHTPYALLPPEVPWKRITERALGFEVHDEFMRRHGAVYRASELRDFRRWFEQHRGTPIDLYLSSVPPRAYSEFNSLGAWLWKFRHGTRHWIRTDVDPMPPLALKQGWSWGGVTPEIRAEIERILA